MTEKEARIFLNMAEDDDPLDAMDEILFQFKKFFTSQTIISSTFEAKLKKLEKIEAAGKVFGIAFEPFVAPEKFRLKEQETMVLVFQEYQSIKNQLYLSLQACNNPQDLKGVVKDLIELQSHYNAFWPEIESIGSAIALSKEQDPMELLMNLKKMKELGVETFKDLVELESIENNNIGLESQRLYLLHQKELQWKKKSSET